MDELRLFDYALNQDEIEWVNSYHQEVWDAVSPLVEDEDVKQWLKDATSPLEVAALSVA